MTRTLKYLYGGTLRLFPRLSNSNITNSDQINKNLVLHKKKSCAWGVHSNERSNDGDLKGWQMKRIAPILDPEYAEEKAVHYKHDASPGEDGDLLSFWVRYPRDFQG